MADRTELLNALSLVKNHCSQIRDCEGCIIYKECRCHLSVEQAPFEWKLEGGDSNGEVD